MTTIQLLEHYTWYVDEEESAGNIPLNYREWLKEYGQIIKETINLNKN